MASSRLWTTGTTGGLAVVVILIFAAFRTELAPWLIGLALIVAAATWFASRRVDGPAGATSPGVETMPNSIAAAGPLLDNVFEALNDPVLIVSGGEADDIAGRRVLMANEAARDLLRIPREGALLVSVMRDPGVIEAYFKRLGEEIPR